MYRLWNENNVKSSKVVSLRQTMLEHLNDILENTQIMASTAAVRLAISFVLGAIIGEIGRAHV